MFFEWGKQNKKLFKELGFIKGEGGRLEMIPRCSIHGVPPEQALT